LTKTILTVFFLRHGVHFCSHHTLQHKLSVVRTFLDRSRNNVTEEEDRKHEEHHIQVALTFDRWARPVIQLVRTATIIMVI